MPAVSRAIRSSAIVRTLEDTLPRPPPLLSQTRGLLDRFGFPQVFADLPPLPAGPVRVAAGQAVRAITDQAAGSTVRIEGRACDAIEEGSGFVVAAGYVVTNAHVVAGALPRRAVRRPRGPGGHARAVRSGPGRGRAPRPGTTGPGTSSVRPGPAPRGEGAVRLSGRRAARRRRRRRAPGDLRGRPGHLRTLDRAPRRLRAPGRRASGNSGGPFVLPSGDVAGIVFAASTTDGNVGYALTSRAVRPDVERAIGRTAPVSTQGCAG